MLNIIGRKNLYFLISLVVIIPGIVSLLLWGLRLSIDFTGGSKTTLLFPSTVNQRTIEKVKSVFKNDKGEIVSFVRNNKRLVIQTKPIDEKQNNKIVADLKESLEGVKQEEFETVGPTIGTETTINAFKTIFFASILIVIFIAYSFRKVPRQAGSWRFGVCAILALVQ